jgi:hypothetical protein
VVSAVLTNPSRKKQTKNLLGFPFVMSKSNHPIEERIDVDYSDWMHQKNQILALTVTCRVQFLAILILACALGFIMFAQPQLDSLPYSSIYFDPPR